MLLLRKMLRILNAFLNFYNYKRLATREDETLEMFHLSFDLQLVLDKK